MKKVIRVLFILCAWLLTLVAGRIFSALWYFGTLSPPVDPEVPVMIAERIGVEPNWEAIQNYVDHAIHLGMKRDEVLNVMNQIGPWQEDSGVIDETDITQDKVYAERIYFVEGNTSRALRGWYFSYEYGKLIMFYQITS